MSVALLAKAVYNLYSLPNQKLRNWHHQPSVSLARRMKMFQRLFTISRKNKAERAKVAVDVSEALLTRTSSSLVIVTK